MRKPIILLIALVICLFLTCIVCVAQEKGENRSSQLTESKVRAMIARAIPHIEAVTGRRFKTELKFRLVDRAFVRDILEGEFELQMKEVLREMPARKVRHDNRK